MKCVNYNCALVRKEAPDGGGIDIKDTCEYCPDLWEGGEKVDHPSHYQGKHECIDLMKALYGTQSVIEFCKCNSFKYRFRAGRKSGADAEEDRRKAEWYEDYLIELRQREGL